MDIDDIVGETSGDFTEGLINVLREHVENKYGEFLRDGVANAIDEMLDGLLDAVDEIAEDGEDYAAGEIDTDDTETTWNSGEVANLMAEAWKAGHNATRDKLIEAIDTAKYRG